MARGRLFVAKETMHVDDRGTPVIIHKGERIREGHRFLKGREASFEEQSVDAKYEVEQATQAPGEKRGAEK